MSQRNLILNYMYSYGALTQRDAYMLGIGRLASRVHELRTDGWNIPKTMVKNDRNNGRHAEYTLSAIDVERIETGN